MKPQPGHCMLGNLCHGTGLDAAISGELIGSHLTTMDAPVASEGHGIGGIVFFSSNVCKTREQKVIPRLLVVPVPPGHVANGN
jgi:hypothetical protein